MIMKPKARKFRIQRVAKSDSTEKNSVTESSSVTIGQAAATAAPAQAESTVDAQIEAIKNEGLTGRQLRMARRVAQKQGLSPSSDYEAVRVLREKGIDPFQKENLLELVVPDTANSASGAPRSSQTSPQNKVQLPLKIDPKKTSLPSTDVNPADRRAQDIQAIQRDILRRRQKKLTLLFTRLAFFVFLPTAIAAYYFNSVATPIYATDSEFLIIQSEGGSSGGGLGGLMSSPFAANTDSIGVQAYLESIEAMLRLDEDLGFKSHFSQDWIDPIQRLDENPSNQQAYSKYQDVVKIGYDPTEGLIRMEVAAADPEISARFADRLISYAEERVNELSAQKREDQMRDARESYERAQADRRAAQENLVRLQIDGQVLDPSAVISSLRGQISAVETQLIEKEIELANLLNNERPNQSRVDAAQGEIRILEEQLVRLRTRMTDVSQGDNSLAELAARLQIAQADLAAADATVQAARATMELTRAEAVRQVRYLTVAVAPVAPDEPSYPRGFENTVLAFIIFAGIYLMISITGSILREQVTS